MSCGELTVQVRHISIILIIDLGLGRVSSKNLKNTSGNLYVPDFVFSEMERNFSSMASSKVSMSRTYVLIERAHMLHFLEHKERNIGFLLRAITEAFFKKKEKLNIEVYRDFFTDIMMHPNPEV